MSKEYLGPDKFDKKKRIAGKNQKIKKINGEFKAIRNTHVEDFKEQNFEDDEYCDFGG